MKYRDMNYLDIMSDDTRQDIRDNLDRYLMNNNFSLAALARKMNTNIPSLKNFLIDPKTRRFDLVIKVARFLDSIEESNPLKQP